ncbi:MAG TPA: calcium-binding protein, partial [Actinomycetales bacterium]|nr:calcium-binding protein [Actinomycetales bacterium]
MSETPTTPQPTPEEPTEAQATPTPGDELTEATAAPQPVDEKIEPAVQAAVETGDSPAQPEDAPAEA